MTTRYRMILAYDGTAYAGWQIQPDARTVQGELERVVQTITGEPVRIHSSGRTDTGVHARAQVIHFDLDRPQPPRDLKGSINAMLDPDIRVLRSAYTDPDFHARRTATGKEYRYFLWDGPVVPPFLRLYRVHQRRRLDVPAMADAAQRLQGEQDFAAFTANPNRTVESTVRTLSRLDVKRKGHEVCISAEANGFLYKMVRSLAGFLVRVGHGELDPSEAESILASRVRTARVPTAAPHGLFLWRVHYPRDPTGRRE